MTRLRGVQALFCAALLVLIAGRAHANPASAALRAKAAAATYNLDHEVALATFKEAVAADPNDAGAYRGLATSLWLSITFRRGNMTVDDYLGRPSGWGLQQSEDYTAHRYHQPSDEYRPDFDLTGAVQLAEIVYRFGASIANAESVPTWNADAEFKVLRDASRKGL